VGADETPKVRYYTFSQDGRRRVPPFSEGSDEAAIDFAKAVNATNVMRETGPLRWPTEVKLIWTRTPMPDLLVTVWESDGTCWTVPRSALRDPDARYI
jgi:hypothetical protein